jgi:hypothetical protein
MSFITTVRIRSVEALITVMLAGISMPGFAQQAAADASASERAAAAQDAEAAAATAAALAKAKAAAAAAAKAESAGAAADSALAKKAADAGWHAEVRHGATMYCQTKQSIGTRFNEKKCFSEAQLPVVLEQQQAAKDQFNQQHSCAGNCGSAR